jgi:hypothetical protein
MIIPHNFTKNSVIAPALIFIFILSVYSNNIRWANAGQDNSKGNTQAFVTYKYVDSMTHMEVFHMLIPKGWKVEGDVKWSSDPALPV